MPIHPLVARTLQAQRDAGWTERHQLGVSESRAQLARRPPNDAIPIPCDVQDGVVGPSQSTGLRTLPVRHYRPLPPRDARSTFVFLHGGGWVLGDLDLSDTFCRELATRADTHVVSVDYRLAPENPYPAALEDTVATIDDLADLHPGSDSKPLAVGGISAGANLAAAATIRQRDQEKRVPDIQVLICPVLDVSCSTDSYRDMATGFYLTAADMRWFWHQYTGEPEPRDDTHGWLSPLHVPVLAGLPPALVVNAEYDVLRDEGQSYADRLTAAGIDSVSVTFAGMIHGFVSDPRLASARAAMDLVVNTIKQLGQDSGEPL